MKKKYINVGSHQALSVNISSLALQPLSARYPLSRHSRCHVTQSPHKRLSPADWPRNPATLPTTGQRTVLRAQKAVFPVFKCFQFFQFFQSLSFPVQVQFISSVFKLKCQQFQFSAVIHVRYPRCASYSRYTNLSYFHIMYKSSCKLPIQ